MMSVHVNVGMCQKTRNGVVIPILSLLSAIFFFFLSSGVS